MRIIFSFMVVVSFLFAKIVDQVAIVVNGEPITTYQINLMVKKDNISRQKAIEILINKAIFEAELKKRGIYVDEFDIDNAMAKIAKRNGMNLFEFRNYLLQKGEFESFRNQLKADLEKRKLVETLNVRVYENDVKDFYNQHKSEFMLPSVMSVIEYNSQNKQSLENIIQNPLANEPNVKTQKITLDINKTNPAMLAFLAKVQVGHFSPIVPLNGFSTFYIESKGKKEALPFKMVAGKIYNQLMNQKAQEALSNLISKLKAKADIEFLIKK